MGRGRQADGIAVTEAPRPHWIVALNEAIHDFTSGKITKPQLVERLGPILEACEADTPAKPEASGPPEAQ